ncbi:LVIVD repeat protein [Sulfurovum sp. AR]|nr:LVIVD repeat protein [Sulfurovum sp. AR]
MTGCGGGGGGGGTGSLSKCSTPIDASFTDGFAGQTRIGGATTSAELLNVADSNWTLYNTANELHATMVDNPESNSSLEVEGYIHDIEIVKYGGNNNTYALLAMGEEGIGVVDVTNPAAMVQRTDLSVKVNYEKTGITIAEGSGSLADINISSSRAPISSLAVYNEGTDVNPSWQLIIGDEGYGLHKTALDNLFNHILCPDDNATLLINSEVYTLQYAGENPWGGPKSLTLYGEGTSTRLFVAQGFLGMGIYDPVNLVKVGQYNLYTDATENNNGEDWFYDMDISAIASTDICTGMPDFNQASDEINGTTPTPWADFEFYGKYYYDARNVEVATVGANTYAYIAYGLAGLVAVDVSNYNTTTAACGNTGTYLGYVPAMPVKGPTDRLIGNQDGSTVFSRAGAGMLQDAGVVDVKVDTKIDPTKVFFTDHFGGLMVVDHAEDPVTFWKEGTGDWGAVNDTDPGTEHVPSYDFVTSYNMTPDPLGGDEALPTFTTDAPILLSTGEVGGHGNALALMDSMDLNNTNTSPADVVMAAGAGGLNFIDLYDGPAVTQYDFNVTDYLATTNEIGAAPVGLDAPAISVGHAAGVGTYDNILYLADGPHGMMAWKVADESCNNIDTDLVRLVGNTLQSESVIGDINPTPHADEVVVTNDGVTKSAMVASLSVGLRRVNVDVLGTDGAPELLYPTAGDIYEHSIEETKLGNISYEDRIYDVEVKENLAYTADGLSGVTVYNLDETPDGSNAAIIVDNIKGTGGDRINNATGIALSGNYAFVAGGATGITVIDISDPSNLSIIKTFQPIKWEDLELDPKAHNADGVAVDVTILDGFAFFTYDSFGVLAYRISDLIDPNYQNPDDVSRPGAPSQNRPNAVGYFKIQNTATYTTSLVADFSDWGGGAAGIDAISATNGKKIIYIAYGNAGVVKLDWSNLWTSPAPATSYETIDPILEQHANTSGKATDVVVWNGRVYVADGAGGLVLLK